MLEEGDHGWRGDDCGGEGYVGGVEETAEFVEDPGGEGLILRVAGYRNGKDVPICHDFVEVRAGDPSVFFRGPCCSHGVEVV